MPQTTCPACGNPVYRSDADTDAGAEVYCSEACAALPTKPKHTPGPWVAKTGPITNDNQCVVMGPDIHEEGETRRVCVVDAVTGTFTKSRKFKPDADCAVRDANARLIAAAPDLLAALREFIEWAERNPNRTANAPIDAARAAVVKAEAK